MEGEETRRAGETGGIEGGGGVMKGEIETRTESRRWGERGTTQFATDCVELIGYS